LAARLDDPDDETRGEAMIGLARRQDLRAMAAIDRDVAAGPSEKAIEAASYIQRAELLSPQTLSLLRS
jgi:hypothetical protein